MLKGVSMLMPAPRAPMQTPPALTRSLSEPAPAPAWLHTPPQDQAAARAAEGRRYSAISAFD